VFSFHTSAINVALPAFAAARLPATRAAAAPTVQQSIDISSRRGRAHSSKPDFDGE